MPAFVDARGVAGVQPAIRVNHGAGSLLVVPVTEHDVGAPDQQRVFVAYFHLNARRGFAHARRQVVIVTVRAGHRTGLGQAIALDHRQTEPDEHAGNIQR